MQTATLPTTTVREIRISRLTGRRPAWQRRLIRGRLIVALLMVVMMVAGIVGAVDADTGPLQTTEHRVASGETLWAIADDLTAPGEDVRASVRMLMEMNGLGDSSLAVGQVLLVPASG